MLGMIGINLGMMGINLGMIGINIGMIGINLGMHRCSYIALVSVSRQHGIVLGSTVFLHANINGNIVQQRF